MVNPSPVAARSSPSPGGIRVRAEAVSRISVPDSTEDYISATLPTNPNHKKKQVEITKKKK